MKVGSFRKPRNPKRPPTYWEKSLAPWLDCNYDSPDDIATAFTQLTKHDPWKLVDAYDNIFLAYNYEEDICLEIYWAKHKRSWEAYYVTYVQQCSDYYEEEQW